MPYLDATRRYFAEWTDTDPSVFSEQGVLAVCSPKRDVRQAGYSRPIHLFCVVTDGTIIISYSKCLEDSIDHIAEEFRQHTELPTLMDALNSILPANIGHSLKFTYNAFPQNLDVSQAVQLTRYGGLSTQAWKSADLVL